MSASRLVIFDLETGGLDPQRHPVIQIAALAVDSDWIELEALEVKVDFDTSEADPGALDKNSYDPKAWAADAIREDVAAAKICKFFREHATVEKVSKRTGNPYWVAGLCGHNVRFDCEFLLAWCKRLGLYVPAAVFEALDTLHLARWIGAAAPGWTPRDYKLETLYKSLIGSDLSEAHDALADVRATAEVARVLHQWIRKGVAS